MKPPRYARPMGPEPGLIYTCLVASSGLKYRRMPAHMRAHLGFTGAPIKDKHTNRRVYIRGIRARTKQAPPLPAESMPFSAHLTGLALSCGLNAGPHAALLYSKRGGSGRSAYAKCIDLNAHVRMPIIRAGRVSNL